MRVMISSHSCTAPYECRLETIDDLRNELMKQNGKMTIEYIGDIYEN